MPSLLQAASAFGHPVLPYYIHKLVNNIAINMEKIEFVTSQENFIVLKIVEFFKTWVVVVNPFVYIFNKKANRENSEPIKRVANSFKRPKTGRL